MVKVLVHPTQVQTLPYTYINIKDRPWAFVFVKLSYFLINFFYSILSTTNHFFLALLDVI